MRRRPRAHPCTKVVLVFLLLLIRWRSTLGVILPLELYFNCHLKTCLGKSLYVDTYTYKYAYPYMPFLIWFFFVFCVLLTSNWKRSFLLFFFLLLLCMTFAVVIYNFSIKARFLLRDIPRSESLGQSTRAFCILIAAHWHGASRRAVSG